MDIEINKILQWTVTKVMAFNQSIKNDLAQKNINNKGIASDSLAVTIDGKSVKSKGIFYLEFLNTGRGPGKFPPVDAMKDYVETKPVSMTDSMGKEMSTNTKAYLVGKGIAERGTKVYRTQSLGIQVENKIINLKKEIKKELPAYMKALITNQLKQFTRKHLQTKL